MLSAPNSFCNFQVHLFDWFLMLLVFHAEILNLSKMQHIFSPSPPQKKKSENLFLLDCVPGLVKNGHWNPDITLDFSEMYLLCSWLCVTYLSVVPFFLSVPPRWMRGWGAFLVCEWLFPSTSDSSHLFSPPRCHQICLPKYSCDHAAVILKTLPRVSIPEVKDTFST